MKIFLIFLIATVFWVFTSRAQDTLECKKDIFWNSSLKGYYEQGKERPYSGPARCFPAKYQINRGSLLNGNWQGRVTGHEKGTYLGYKSFDNGFLHGPSERFSNGQRIDSSWYDKGLLVYRKTWKFSTIDILMTIREEFPVGDSSRLYTFSERSSTYPMSIERFKGKKKEGKSSYFLAKDDLKEERFYRNGAEVERIVYHLSGTNQPKKEHIFYTNGVVVKRICYFDDFYSVYPYRKGRKHGVAADYFYDSSILMRSLYIKGKFIRFLEKE